MPVRYLRREWDRLVEQTHTGPHARHTLVTVMLMQRITREHVPGYMERHRRMVATAILALERMEFLKHHEPAAGWEQARGERQRRV